MVKGLGGKAWPRASGQAGPATQGPGPVCDHQGVRWDTGTKRTLLQEGLRQPQLFGSCTLARGEGGHSLPRAEEPSPPATEGLTKGVRWCWHRATSSHCPTPQICPPTPRKDQQRRNRPEARRAGARTGVLGTSHLAVAERQDPGKNRARPYVETAREKNRLPKTGQDPQREHPPWEGWRARGPGVEAHAQIRPEEEA